MRTVEAFDHDMRCSAQEIANDCVKSHFELILREILKHYFLMSNRRILYTI